MLHRQAGNDLPVIPVIDVGADFPLETLEIAAPRAYDLLDEAGAGIPRVALRAADAVSRRWLAHQRSPYLDEIERIAHRLGRPGAYYFNVSYEWGCSTSVGPCPEGHAARLMRVLDWPNNGLGRHLVAVRIDGPAGPWVTPTWPGYTGVVQAMAPGRFAAALNQAPMARPVGLLPVDWVANRIEVWRSPHLTPAHLLRQAFERAHTFAEARRLLTETPIALSTIYSLSGTRPDEACIIERQPEAAYVIDGPASAANEWQNPAWRGRVRGLDNELRARMMAAQTRSLDATLSWPAPPVLNETTRLVLEADASAGRLIVRGYEADGPATRVLTLQTHEGLAA